MPAPTTDRLVEIGIVGRPHGVRGELRVLLYNPASDILGRVPRVLLRAAGDKSGIGGVPYAVAGVRQGPHGALLTLEGVGDRDEAARLKGARLLLPRSSLPGVDDDEFYVDDLMGLEVRHGGTPLGVISGSREQGGVEIVTVTLHEPADGPAGEIEIPLVEGYVARLSLVDGLLEVRDIGELPRNPGRPGGG